LISALLLSAVPTRFEFFFDTLQLRPWNGNNKRTTKLAAFYSPGFPIIKKFIFYFCYRFYDRSLLDGPVEYALWHNNGFLIDFLVEK